VHSGSSLCGLGECCREAVNDIRFGVRSCPRRWYVRRHLLRNRGSINSAHILGTHVPVELTVMRGAASQKKIIDLPCATAKSAKKVKLFDESAPWTGRWRHRNRVGENCADEEDNCSQDGACYSQNCPQDCTRYSQDRTENGTRCPKDEVTRAATRALQIMTGKRV
jgi:hypothetical protein